MGCVDLVLGMSGRLAFIMHIPSGKLVKIPPGVIPLLLLFLKINNF